jgi:hypothetical protein
MIFDQCLCSTVIAVHQGFGIVELGRHWLAFYRSSEPSKLHLHIHYAPTTNRAFVGILNVFFVAGLVYRMATRHANHRLGGIEHVLATNRTIAIGDPLHTTMSISNRDG